MPSPSPAQTALLATERWSWLAAFLDRWYAEPLRPEDGSTPGELAAAEARIGRALPVALAEWFTLVGRRLAPVQDAAATPPTLCTVDGGVSVWFENQGCWTVLTAPGDTGEDPRCVLDEPGYDALAPAPLTTVLKGMLLSDTLVGAWAGDRVGPLGPLAASVRGGMFEDAPESATAALGTAYPALPVAGNPFIAGPVRGDAATALRGGEWLEWMTADDDAYARLGELLPLDPEGGEHEVVLAFEDPAPERRRLVVDANGSPATARFANAVAGLGHLGMASATRADVRFHVRTTRPEETARVLAAAVPPELAECAVVAVRPVRVSVFRVAYPAGRDAYAPAPANGAGMSVHRGVDGDGNVAADA